MAITRLPLLPCLLGLSFASATILGCSSDGDDPGSEPVIEQPDIPGWESLLAAHEKLLQGEDEVALSSDGTTWRYRRQRVQDTITHEEVLRNGAATLVWDHTGTTSMGASDAQPDGVVERRFQITRGAGSDGTIIITDDPEDDGRPDARTTFIKTGDAVSVLVEVADVTGNLVVVEEYETTALQALRTQATPTPFDSSCNPGDVETIAPKLLEGVTKGIKCLKDNGQDDIVEMLLNKIAKDGVKVECTPLPNNECAEIDFTDSILRGGLPLSIGIKVDTNTFNNHPGCTANQAGALFHELLHVALGPHSFGATPSNDQIYACQLMCFNKDPGSVPQAGKCHCAKCLGTDECDPRCDSFPDCPGQAPMCDAFVLIEDAKCETLSCMCGDTSGVRLEQSITGLVRGPVGTLLQVNAPVHFSASIECGQWSPDPCPFPDTLRCCRRTSEDQPFETRFSALVPVPGPSECLCPPMSWPGYNWVAQAEAPKAGQAEESQRTGPTCP